MQLGLSLPTRARVRFAPEGASLYGDFLAKIFLSGDIMLPPASWGSFNTPAKALFDGAGALASHGADSTPIAYDEAGLALGWPIEPDSTNLVLWSQSIPAWSNPGGSVTTTADGEIAGVPAYRLSGQTLTWHRREVSAGTLTAATPYAFSIFLAPVTAPAALIRMRNSGAGTESWASLDLITGALTETLGAAGAFSNLATRAVSGGWHATGVFTPNGTSEHRAGINTGTTEPADAFRATGLQLEEGMRSTSYIATTSAAAARAPDEGSLTTGAWFSATSGTLLVEIAANTVLTTESWAAFSDGTTQNAIVLGRGVSGEATASLVVSGTPVALSATGLPASGIMRLVLAWDGAGASLRGTGTALDTTPVSGLPTVDRLELGADGASAGQSGIHMRRISYWPNRLTDGTLASLVAD